jgi:hypothetical protein
MRKSLIVINIYKLLEDGTGKITENDVYALCKKYFGGPLAE